MFQVPIIVIPGMSHNAVRMQLETLLMQPGLNPEMVTVSAAGSFHRGPANPLVLAQHVPAQGRSEYNFRCLLFSVSLEILKAEASPVKMS